MSAERFVDCIVNNISTLNREFVYAALEGKIHTPKAQVIQEAYDKWHTDPKSGGCGGIVAFIRGKLGDERKQDQPGRGNPATQRYRAMQKAKGGSS